MKTTKETLKSNGSDPSESGRSTMARLAYIPGLLLLAACACVFVSCASIDSKTTSYAGAPHYPPSDPASVQVLRTQPPQPHERIGEVVVDASTTPAPPVSEVEERLRKDAAKIGADAVVVVLDRVQTEGMYVTGGYWNQTAEPITGRKVVGVAIKYRLTPTGSAQPYNPYYTPYIAH